MRNVIDTEHVSIRETSPCKRVICCRSKVTALGWTVETYYLDFPYIQYYFFNKSSKLYISASEKPFNTKHKNDLFHSPTFNVKKGMVCQQVCYGSLLSPKVDFDKTIDLFWNSLFTEALPPCSLNNLQPSFGARDAAIHSRGKQIKEYYEHWQKNGWTKTPISFPHFTSDPNYFKDSNYFAPGRFVCCDRGVSIETDRYKIVCENPLSVEAGGAPVEIQAELVLKCVT